MQIKQAALAFRNCIESDQYRYIIIDEVHSFIKRVNSQVENEITKTCQLMYSLILKNQNFSKTIALSATPITKDSYELSLLFNMLDKDCLPLD